jgi:hypothetical protein
VGQQAAGKVLPQRRQGFIVLLTDTQIVLALSIPQAQVQMQTAAGQVGVRFGHKTGYKTGLAGQRSHHFLEGQVIVYRLKRLVVVGRGFVLGRAVFLAQLVHFHTHVIQVVNDSLPQRVMAVQPGHGKHAIPVRRTIFALVIRLKQNEFRFKSHPQPQSGGGIGVYQPLQLSARATLPGRPIVGPHEGVNPSRGFVIGNRGVAYRIGHGQKVAGIGQKNGPIRLVIFQGKIQIGPGKDHPPLHHAGKASFGDGFGAGATTVVVINHP